MAVALKILLVEDSAIDAELAAYELAKLGMAVEWNRVSTEEALRQALLEFCPSVILSDHLMPAFDGLSALHIASEMTPEIPFIFLSGTIGEEMAIEALKGGATDYVLKANLARLGAAVVRAVREASNKQARLRAEAARARLAAILEATPDFVGIYDAARMFTYINAGGRRLLRLGRDADKGLAVSRACEAARLSRAAYYRPVADVGARDQEIVAALNEIVATELRWGFWKCFDRLRQLGKPWNHKRVHRVYCQNAYIERFNRSYREEVLNAYLFDSVTEVQHITDDWLKRYNENSTA